jgi:hypothetical protein
VRFGGELAEREPQAPPGPARGGAGVGLHEPFEDAPAQVGRHPAPGVGDAQLDLVAVPAGRHAHRGARRRVPDGVLDQVLEHPA